MASEFTTQETKMEIRSILVNIDIAAPDSPALRYAIDLASKVGASLIGVAADQPNIAYAGIDGGAAVVDVYSLEISEIETQLRRAEEAFQARVPPTIARQWRAFVTERTTALIETAGIADLVVTSQKTTTTFQQRQMTDLGALVLSSGRPIIDVASTASEARFEKICIGWKDTREARRAVADALPFLKMAKEVVALTVSDGDYTGERASLNGLLSWLKTHDVSARADVVNNPEAYVDVLETQAISQNADLLVIGGYGHSRMREWLFGGVTRSVLGANLLNRLLSN
jgi:nucleotide-binding universal stress UspA family protein